MPPSRLPSSRPSAPRLARVVGVVLLAATFARDAGAEDRVRLLVQFQPAVEAGERRVVARRLGGTIPRDLGGDPGRMAIAAVEVPASAVDALRRDPRVRSVEADPLVHAAALGFSELVPSIDNGLYGLVLTHAIDAQARRITGTGVRVCIADSGIDARHPDLARAYGGGFDLVDGDDDPDVGPDIGLGGHGTMVAGVIAAALNRKGVRGVAPDAEIFHARVLGPEGTAPTSDVMAAVQRLVENEGCRIVNLSLGSSQRTDAEESFYRDLLARHDVLVVAASGNDSHDSLSYPAGYPGVLAVGAVDRNGVLAAFSNTGAGLDLVAPGVNVLSTATRGSGSEAYVKAPRPIDASAFIYAGYTPGIRGRLVDCGTGNTPEEFPRTVRGAIALMKRGDAFFSVKVENAMNAGARGAVIYNNVPEPTRGTLQTETASDGRRWIPAVLVSEHDGEVLLGFRKPALVVNGPTDWDVASGTSFAAPHVSGAAALLLSVDPSLGSDDLVRLLETTAVDLGDPGLDPAFGWGLIDADAAARAAAEP